jgi:hypothetical protein
MNEHPKTMRRAVRRQEAERYLLITLLSFAASVSLTRLFLELAGYPQIGNSELHIAHVLWGGLLLFISALLPLMFANRWMLTISAVLSGVGVGLFIDEVGKFITQSNDYFYPAAAPIIYAFFLMTVLVYMLVRRPRGESIRSDLYYILQDLEEVVDRDLSANELDRIMTRLERVESNSEDRDLSYMARSLTKFLEHEALHIVPERSTWWNRTVRQLRQWEQQHLSYMRFRAALVGGLTGWGIWAISFPVRVMLSIRSPEELTVLVDQLVEQRLVSSFASISWFGARVGLEGSFGLLIILSAVLLAIGRERRALLIAYFALLTMLTVVNVLLFYFDQFSTIANAIVQFILLLAVLRYRSRFLRDRLIDENDR